MTVVVPLERVGVVGCGVVGSGVAELCARSGMDVVVSEVDERASAASQGRIESSMARAVRRKEMRSRDREAALARLRFTTGLGGLGDRQLVVEALPESQTLKLAVFTGLDEVLEQSDAIVATCTSSLSVLTLAMGTARPERVVGLEFFSPASLPDLVELVTTVMTAPAAADTAHAFAQALGKRVIRSPDRAGFVVNAVVVPYVLSAIRMVGAGRASPADVDAAMVVGCNHPMGPLALADLIGLDTTLAIARSIYDELRDASYLPPRLLTVMVDAGVVGQKAGRGFYDYHDLEPSACRAASGVRRSSGRHPGEVTGSPSRLSKRTTRT